MAYSNIKKPAFYVPMLDYLHSIGNIKYKDDSLNDIHFLNPTKTHIIEPDDNWYLTSQIEYEIEFNDNFAYFYKDFSDEDGFIYIFILGHNLHSVDCSIEIQLKDGDNYFSPNTYDGVVNFEGGETKPSGNGFSIIKAGYGANAFDGIKIIIRGFGSESNNDIKLGCISLCSKWTPPHNPDLSLSMSRQYDGVRTIRTKGGATLSNAQYTRGGQFWATSYPWEVTLGDYNESSSEIQAQRTLGRRVWSMNFSYLTPANLMPEFETLNHFDTEYAGNDDKNILQSQSFFARVLNRVQGSHLPFIFQPNDTDDNTNPDQWAIVRFDQKDFSITQAAPELYSLSMKLTESY